MQVFLAADPIIACGPATERVEAKGGAASLGNNERSAASPARTPLLAAGAVEIDRKLRRSTRVRAEMTTPIVAAAFYGVLWDVESRRPHRHHRTPDQPHRPQSGSRAAPATRGRDHGRCCIRPRTLTPAPVAPLHGLRRGRQQLRSGDVGVGPGVRHLVPAHAAPWTGRTRCGPYAQLP